MAYSDDSNFGTDMDDDVPDSAADTAEAANAVAVVYAVDAEANVDVDCMDAVGDIITAGEGTVASTLGLLWPFFHEIFGVKLVQPFVPLPTSLPDPVQPEGSLGVNT